MLKHAKRHGKRVKALESMAASVHHQKKTREKHKQENKFKTPFKIEIGVSSVIIACPTIDNLLLALFRLPEQNKTKQRRNQK